MLLCFHSRKHLQKYAVTFFHSELVWLLAAFTCHVGVSELLFLIGCGPVPDLQLCPCYLYLKNPLKAGNNRHFRSKYYLRLSMLPANQTALCVLIPVQTTRQVYYSERSPGFRSIDKLAMS